jgi:acetyl coenzyme A synthetase (ADP forming)-like protein
MDHLLESFFNPNGVAVIGASSNPAKLSYGVVHNLKEHGYRGPIYPVNPGASEILGLKAYPGIADVPDPIELAVIMVGAAQVAETLEACGRRGLKVVIVISGGFKETGPEGAELERALPAIAARYGMRLIGPNCVGVMDTHTRLDTTFITAMPVPGSIGFASHSGAVCGGTIDWAIEAGLGFSRIASLGNQVDVDLADGLRMLYADPHTKVISLYAEGLPDGRRFVDAAAEVYRHKPVVVLKAGRTSAGTRAVASHTGALAGAGRAYQAACHRAAVISVNSLQEQNDVAAALALQPLPAGPRAVLLTNAGGPAALAADALDEFGLKMADLTGETQDRLRAVTPKGALVGNPVDMLGGPQAEMYADAIRVLLQDPGVDMILALFVPQAITPVDLVADAIVAGAQDAAKPVAACLVGGHSIAQAVRRLHGGGVPVYTDPNRAARGLAGLWEYAQLRARPDLTPTSVTGVDRDKAGRLLAAAWSEARERRFLDAETAAQVAAAYGIRVPRSGLAQTAEEAVALAQSLGYPVVLKLIAADVVHKADVGGIALNLTDPSLVRAAFGRLIGRRPDARALVQQMAPAGQEVILGMERDPQFGPLLMFGMGGVYVEVLRDVAFRLAPLSDRDAEAMVAETAVGRILRGVRGQPPGDLAAVVDTLRRVGQLVTDFPCLAELDLNPLIVGAAGQGAWAVDARMAIDQPPL